MFQNPMDKPISRRLVGLAAIVYQHEIDHLNGLLLSDFGIEIDEDFYNASEEERQELIEPDLDTLDLKQKELIKRFKKMKN